MYLLSKDKLAEFGLESLNKITFFSLGSKAFQFTNSFMGRDSQVRDDYSPIWYNPLDSMNLLFTLFFNSKARILRGPIPVRPYSYGALISNSGLFNSELA